MKIPAHSHMVPHVHIPTLHFIVPHTVGLPAWWWVGTFMLVPWSMIAFFLFWFYRNARQEDEVRINKIEEDLK